MQKSGIRTQWGKNMFSKRELQEILAQGENSSVEFKGTRVRPESLAKEMTAFANSSGGLIFIGVDDTGRIEGLDESKNYEEWTMVVARNNVSPALTVEYMPFEIEGKPIGVVSVPKGKDKPYQTADKYLIRVGSTNRSATQAELLRLFQSAGVFHYDSVAVPETSMKDINLTKIDQYFRQYDIDFLEESETEKHALLTNTDILAESKEATIAGLLVFGINPTRRLPQCGISCAHFADTEIDSELIDKPNIEDTLDFQVNTALAVIKNNLRVPSTIISARREPLNTLPADKVFRELLVNACVHRNYSITGSRIRVFMFPDRIEFISPGRLPNTVTIEKIKAGVSYSVNPVIVKFMENLRYIDRLGRGLPMVCREMEKIKGTIEFKEIGEEFKVTLHW